MQATHVRVVNDNDFMLEDRWDGIVYRFPSKDTGGKLIPILAAALFFGFRVSDDERGLTVDFGTNEDGTIAVDWRYVQRRWGWNTIINRKDEDLAQAVERTQAEADDKCKKLRLMPVTLALREVAQGSVPATLLPPRDAESEKKPAAKMRAE